MAKEYLTKTELCNRWSRSLVELYFPYCSKELPNPRHKRGAPMQLYNIRDIRTIETKDEFREEWMKVQKKRLKRLKNKQSKNETG